MFLIDLSLFPFPSASVPARVVFLFRRAPLALRSAADRSVESPPTHRATIQTATDKQRSVADTHRRESRWRVTTGNERIRTLPLPPRRFDSNGGRRSSPCPTHAAHSHSIVCTLHSFGFPVDPAVHSLDLTPPPICERLVVVHHSTRTQPRRCTAIRRRPPRSPSAAHAAAAVDSSRLLRPRTQPIHSLAAATAAPLLAAATRARALDRLDRQLRPRSAGLRARLPVLRHGRQPV